MLPHHLELAAEQLRRIADPASFGFETTDELSYAEQIIGQPRGTRALEFGLEMRSPGFNIYVLGPAGTGRATAIERFVQSQAAEGETPPDWCYVYNFTEPHRPCATELPAGQGRAFRQNMAELVEHLRAEIPRAFAGEVYEKARSEVRRSKEERQAEVFSELEAHARQEGFALMQTPAGLSIAPLIEGQAISPEQFAQLPPETQQELETKGRQLQTTIAEAMRQVQQIEKQARQQAQQLDQEIVKNIAAPAIQEMAEKYADSDEIRQYLEQVLADIITHIGDFKAQAQESPVEAMGLPMPPKEPSLLRYQVNLIVDNSQTTGAPVAIENNPSYHNLMGRVEHEARLGSTHTDFTMIKAGALHRANGGYLILNASDVLSKPLAWEALKRAVKTGEIRLEELTQQYQLVATSTLEPEPIPLEVKVVLVGSPTLYYLLYGSDEDFRKWFKVKADFDVDMDWAPETQHQYALFIRARCKEEALLPFDKSAVAQVLEHGARLAGDQQKLTTRFGLVADLVREASFWASRNGHVAVTAGDVRQAIEEQVYRANMIEERSRELIQQGTIMVDTEEERVGQVNGLSVVSIGDYNFGRPSRVTARTFAGKGNVTAIEREVNMSGRLHNKGVLTLTSFLNAKFAQKKPLSLSASITFEQTYERVEGDSASSTELYALLSSLSGYPIKQGIAVTGSVNQHGQIQPIGGATPKIEGFFQICQARGLTGHQGVIIPAQNVRHLMLCPEVVDAVRAGQFHIYAISSIDEGIAVLTGREAGEPDKEGNYPTGSVYHAVVQRLEEMAEKPESKEAGEDEANKSPSKEARDEDQGEPEKDSS
ncbi:MAG: AAA family ATPase [Anaerolineae bacterium]|nr:MAG: AAA family ATPase [Anaerolineae bacterium]